MAAVLRAAAGYAADRAGFAAGAAARRRLRTDTLTRLARARPELSRSRHSAELAAVVVDRIEALPKIIRDIGWKAQVRLCARYRRLSARGKNANVVNIAIAREMVGFIWSNACTIQSAPRTA